MTPLRRRMIEEMRMIHNYSTHSIAAYVSAVYRLANHYGRRPDQLSREEVRAFLVDLVEAKQVNWSYYKQVLAAQRYFYRHVVRWGEIVDDVRYPRPEKTLPVVLSSTEVCVLKYLARYTQRVAISNRRLLAYQAGRVTFQYEDYTQAGRTRRMTLWGSEFIRWFLLHVLPKGFMRIRQYGYLANRHRQQKLALCRRLLGEPPPIVPADDSRPAAGPLAAHDDHAAAAITCPVCQRGVWRIVHSWDRYSPAACQPPPVAAKTGRQKCVRDMNA